MKFKIFPYQPLIKELFLPKDDKLLGLLIAISKPLIYYSICFFLNKEQLEVMMLYNTGLEGDAQYYQFLPYLGNLQLGESQVYELQGEGIIGFSLPSMLLHSLLFARLGVFGFILADIIITYLFFCLIFFILKLIKTPHFLAVSLALLIISGTIIDNFFETFFFLDDFTIWGIRFPRPFVSELFLLAVIAQILFIFSEPKQLENKYYWIFLSLWISLNLQADPFVAFGLIIVTILSLIFAFWLFKAWQFFIESAIISSIFLIIFTLPFIVQQLFISEDIKSRYGVFPLKGLHFLPLESYRFADLKSFTIKFLIILTIELFIYIKFFKKANLVDKQIRLGANIFAIILIPSGYFAMTFFILVAHQAIQLYHFYEVYKTFCSYAALFAFSFLCTDLSKFFKLDINKFFTKKKVKLFAYIFVLALSLTAISYKYYGYASLTSHVRHNVYGLLPKEYYRQEFNELVKELKKPVYQNLKVLGTFDHQVQVYWETFRQGNSYLPDIFISTISDDEAEKRLIKLAKVIGMNEEQFINYIKGDSGINGHINLYWGLAKYQVNQEYTFRNLTEYTPKQRQKIQTIPITETWNIMVPESEIKRMREKFINTKIESLDNPRLDVIILSNDSIFDKFSPSSKDFQQVFENKIFRMWIRKS